MLNFTVQRVQVTIKQSVTPFKIVFCVLSILCASCVAPKRNQTEKNIRTKLQHEFYGNQFTGILVVDSETNDTLIAQNSARYFLPASNVKLFTLYTGLKLLPEQIPTLGYYYENDTLHIEGTGDPSWLHPYFNDRTAVSFIKGYENIVLYLTNFQDGKFGPGWAWEDYEYYFSPERGALPLYGNVVNALKNDSLVILPKHFKAAFKIAENKNLRQQHTNEFALSSTFNDTIEIPFITDNRLTQILLQKETGRQLTVGAQFPKGKKQILYGLPTDSIYRRMLYESDNFLAEQLMITASSMLSDTLRFNTARDAMLKVHLSNLRQQPRWVDGSGLSRYNLFTPESMVQVLTKLLAEIPEKRLYHLLPTWDADGTIKEADESAESDFIHAKSGGMGNTYNLSGYLTTKSGKVLVFSFMNNHFRRSSSEVRQNMYGILKSLHDSY